MGVVHAHSRVVIDCRVPQESVIRIVSTMGTKESISYKMITHGSWYRQIEKGRERTTAKTREEERGKATGKSREEGRGRNYSRKQRARGRQRISVCRHRKVEARRE